MPKLLSKSFKRFKLQEGWSWPLSATDLSGVLEPALDLDAFLNIHFWEQQDLHKHERDSRMEASRFRALELRTELEPSGLGRPKEMPKDVPLLVRAWVFPVPRAAFPSGTKLRPATTEALRLAVNLHRIGGGQVELDLTLRGSPCLVQSELRRWDGLRPLVPERKETPIPPALVPSR